MCKVIIYLVANVSYYKMVHKGDISKDAESYFTFGSYCDSVPDVSIIAIERALKLNLSIYQKGPKGNIQILKQTTHTAGREVYLTFTWDLCNLANNHNDAILLCDKPAEICQQDEVIIESPSPTSLQLIIQDYADEVFDLTDDSETTVVQHPELVPYNNNNNELQFLPVTYCEHSTRIGGGPATGCILVWRFTRLNVFWENAFRKARTWGTSCCILQKGKP